MRGTEFKSHYNNKAYDNALSLQSLVYIYTYLIHTIDIRVFILG